MVASVTFNPMQTVSAFGSFNIQSDGYIQGQAQDAPAARNDLVGGILNANQTLPIWGGCAVSEWIPSSSTSIATPTLGPQIIRATTTVAGAAGTLLGWSVFDQAHAYVNTPQSPVPMAGAGQTVNYYRLGSFARIAVACDPSLFSLQGGLTSQSVTWDFNNQMLQPYDASTATTSITSMTWSATNGGQIAIVAASSYVGAVGDVVYISGATNTGTGGATVVNGSFVVNTFTSSTNFTVLATAAAGVFGTIGGTMLLNMGTGSLNAGPLLNVRVLDVAVGNSMTVSYNPTTGFATWNRSGSCALIII